MFFGNTSPIVNSGTFLNVRFKKVPLYLLFICSVFLVGMYTTPVFTKLISCREMTELKPIWSNLENKNINKCMQCLVLCHMSCSCLMYML